MSATKVVITGIGTANPLGVDFASTAAALLQGKSGVRRMDRFDISQHPSRIAGMIPDLSPPEGISAEEFSNLSPYQQLLIHCGLESLRHAAVEWQRDSLRVGLVLGLGAEYLVHWETDGDRMTQPHREPPGLTRWLHQRLGLNGPCSTVAAACASGNMALGLARLWVQQGIVDVCLAGAADRSLTQMGMAGFGNLGALSKRNDHPEAASRPFDRDRDGFVMSEGGAIYVLESESSARRRGAKIFAELMGFGASSDAHHPVIPSSDPGPAARAIQSALRDAELNPEQVDYLNAHATSTGIGDPFETRTIQAVFGELTSSLAVSSTKSMSGHLLGAASAFEAMACLTAFEEGAIPPTINLENVDPVCAALRHVANQAEERRVEIALSNSFGFGGSNTCVVLKRAG